MYPVGGGAYVGHVGQLSLQHVAGFLDYGDRCHWPISREGYIQTRPQTNCWERVMGTWEESLPPH